MGDNIYLGCKTVVQLCRYLVAVHNMPLTGLLEVTALLEGDEGDVVALWTSLGSRF